mmetsp:Transcript_20041/g.52749  ORF Transcript_20041/g.52749 Transcript_20041/m.52749 type:complete len:240 (-) Transcript_20041:32-751(-)
MLAGMHAFHTRPRPADGPDPHGGRCQCNTEALLHHVLPRAPLRRFRAALRPIRLRLLLLESLGGRRLRALLLERLRGRLLRSRRLEGRVVRGGLAGRGRGLGAPHPPVAVDEEHAKLGRADGELDGFILDLFALELGPEHLGLRLDALGHREGLARLGRLLASLGAAALLLGDAVLEDEGLVDQQPHHLPGLGAKDFLGELVRLVVPLEGGLVLLEPQVAQRHPARQLRRLLAHRAHLA